MYPRASYPERPMDSRVFVARSNSWSKSTPWARSLDRSCGTTEPRYPRAAFYLFETAVSAPLSRREVTFGRDGICAPRAVRTRPRPSLVLERPSSDGRAGLHRPSRRLDGLRTLRHLGPSRWRPRHVDPDRRQGHRSPNEDPSHVRRVRDHPARLYVRVRSPWNREAQFSSRRDRRSALHRSPGEPARGLRTWHLGPIRGDVSVRPSRQGLGRCDELQPEHGRTDRHGCEYDGTGRDSIPIRGEHHDEGGEGAAGDPRPRRRTVRRLLLSRGPVPHAGGFRTVSRFLALSFVERMARRQRKSRPKRGRP